MRRSARYSPGSGPWGEFLYDTWPTKREDTREGLLLAADRFERQGDVDKAEQIRKGAKAFEGRKW